METSSKVNRLTSLTGLAGGILRDSRKLAGQEMALAKAELWEEWKKTKQAALGFSLAHTIAATACVVLSLSLAQWLRERTGLPASACGGIVGLALACLTLLSFGIARARAARIHVVPTEAVASIMESVECLKKQS